MSHTATSPCLARDGRSRSCRVAGRGARFARRRLFAAVLIVGLLSSAIPLAPNVDLASSLPAAPAARAQSGPSENAVFLPRVLRGGGAVDVTPSDRLGGTTHALLGRGDRVFAGIDDRLVVFDVSEPSDPRPLASAPGLGADIEAMVMDELLYVAAGEAGLHVFEVYEAGGNEDETPVHRYGMDLGAPVRDLALTDDGRLAAAVDGQAASLILLELADAARPRVQARLATAAGGATRLASREELVYLARTGTDLAVVDIGEVGSPTVVFEAGRPDERSVLTDLLWTGFDLVIPIRHRESSMGAQIVWSIRDPRAPVQEPGPSIDKARSGRSVGYEGQLYIAYLDDTGRAGLLVATLSDAEGEAPYSLHTDLDLAPRGFEALSFDFAAGRLLAGGPTVQLMLLDVPNSEPGKPVELGRHQAADGAIGRVAVSSDVVLTITDDPTTFTVLDHRTSRPLSRAGVYPLEAEDLRAATVQMAADRRTRHAYLMYYDSLQVMDAVGMDAPEPRKLLAAPGGTVIALDSDHLYVGAEGLRVFDVRNPARTEEIAHAFRAGYSEAIAADAGRVYMAQKEPTRGRPVSLQVWDVQNRTKPVMAGSLGDVGFTVSMAARGAYAYQVYRIDERDFGVQAYDASDPGRVRPLDRFVTQGYAHELVREGTRLYLIEESFFDRRTRRQMGRTGVHVLDIANPARISPIGFIPFETPVLDIDVREGVVFAALGEAGLMEVDTGLRPGLR